MAKSDSELLHQAIHGDEDALMGLLNNHGPRLRARLAAQMPRRFSYILTVDDVLQVTYMDVFLDIGQFEPNNRSGFAAWLMKIAENNLRTAIKALEARKRPDSRKRICAGQREDSFADLFELLGGTGTTPSSGAARNEIQSTLEAAIARLPRGYRDVVRLHDLEGHDMDTVAATMDRSVGAVFMLRLRAHRKLQTLLGSESDFFTDPN